MFFAVTGTIYRLFEGLFITIVTQSFLNQGKLLFIFVVLPDIKRTNIIIKRYRSVFKLLTNEEEHRIIAHGGAPYAMGTEPHHPRPIHSRPHRKGFRRQNLPLSLT